jgi:lipopolysaccharide export system permease protein
MKKTLFFYILKEILPIFFIALLVFTTILLMDKILKLIELIVTKGATFYQILMLLLFISPSFLIFTIPIAFLCGTLLSFGRFSSDGEIIAFKASGISLYQLFYPVLFFSIAACLLTSFLVFYGLPWGNRGFKAMLYLVAQSRADVELKERVFNDMFDGLVVYIDKIPIDNKKMEGILIFDERERDKIITVFAKEGFLTSNPREQEIIFRLINGDIHRYDQKSHVYQKVNFNYYDIKLELAKAFSTIGKKLKDKELSIEELKEKIKELKKKGENVAQLEVELQKRYAFPFACIIFGMIGVPLGIQPRRSGRSYGFIFTFLIILLYYFSLSTFEIFGPGIGMSSFLTAWGPNFLFGAFSIFLLIRTSKEKSFKGLDGMVRLVDLMQYKLERVFKNV